MLASTKVHAGFYPERHTFLDLKMKEKLGRPQLLELNEKLLNPGDYTEGENDDFFLRFCAGSPDPIGAWWLLVECLDPMVSEETVGRASFRTSTFPARVRFSIPRRNIRPSILRRFNASVTSPMGLTSRS